jgi:flavin reductase (DIM6/NTAB) family NADH-FMN oxidoreductase RutF
MRLRSREIVDTTDFASSSTSPVGAVSEARRESCSLLRLLFKPLIVLGARFGDGAPNELSSSSFMILGFGPELVSAVAIASDELANFLGLYARTDFSF